MKLLAIDTATEACSVALWVDGQVIEHFEVAGRGHSVRLPQMVPALLAEAGLRMQALDGLVSGVGPGSFAGVRIGVSYVKGLALGLGLPVVGVTSLTMLAQAVLHHHADATVLAAIDARMGEVYFGSYRLQSGVLASLQPESVCAPDAIPMISVAPPLIGTGSGWGVHAAAMQARVPSPLQIMDAVALPHARDALVLAEPAFAAGQAVDSAQLVPVYLRNQVALTKIEQQALRASR